MRAKVIRSFLRDVKGQSAVEMTFIFPLLLSLIGGGVDFGLSFFVSHIVQHAAREGARLAVTLPNLAPNDATIVHLVKSKIPDVNLFTTFKTDGNITVSATTFPIHCDSENEADKEVTVEIEGTYSYTLLRIVGLTTSNMKRTSTMRYECG